MSKENCRNVLSYKQSFKAVENFLRRVAYNLGNTRSQTEVKIISCIPIDVTDLQQRIFQLQNELADVKEKNCNKDILKDNKESIKVCGLCTNRADISARQVYCNECLHSGTSVLSIFCPGGRSISQLNRKESFDPLVSHDNIEPKTDETTKSRNFIAKKRKAFKKIRSRIIYCAQTATNNPFNKKFGFMDEIASIEVNTGSTSDPFSRSYLADVIKRQFSNQKTNISNLSDISTPVCRDFIPTSSHKSRHFESDVCSCIHGNFQNVDKYMDKNIFLRDLTSETGGNFNKNAYYDSNFYDLVPVKENKSKNRKEIEKRKVKEPKRYVTKYTPEWDRQRHRAATPTLVNYCTVAPLNGRPAPAPARRIEASTPRRRCMDLELGPVYTKQPRVPTKKNTFTITEHQYNVAAGPSTGNTVATHETATTTSTITDAPEDKTEITLNQIKNMLQSVLTEVKTNNIAASSPSRSKKDAVVQYGPGRGYEFGASQLLQSYTYSPYNMNPMNPYIPPCPPPISCSNCVYPEFPRAPGVPFQQYPLLIQPQKLCHSYYRNNSFSKPLTKHAMSAGTNTEQAHERSKETKHLIKEIYKSMALNLEDSSKDNSYREYTEPAAKSKLYVDEIRTESSAESKSIAQVISEIFRNTNPRDSTVTGTTDTSLNSYLNPNKPRILMENTVKNENNNDRIYPQSKYSSRNKREKNTEQKNTYHEEEEESDQSDDTLVEDTEEESSEESQSTAVVEVKKEPIKPTKVTTAKSGIFKKMLKIFQPKSKRRRRVDETNESKNESESDSDDYQTVYSQNIVEPSPKPKKTQAVIRSRPHSKVFYVKQPQVRRSRTRSPEKKAKFEPYMEQEYRRRWDEKLMSQEDQRRKHTTTTSRQTADRDQRYRHVYHHSYEARPLFIDTKRPLTTPRVPKSQYTPHKNHYTTYIRPPSPVSYYQNNPNSINTTGPHYITAKSNGSRKGPITRVLRKCKPQCTQLWKDLVVHG